MNSLRGEAMDPLARLRILSVALPGTILAAKQIKATFRSTWQVIDGLERFALQYESAVAGVRTLAIDGSRRRLIVTYRNGLREEVDALVRPGWCLMQSRSAVVALAARPEGQGTLIGHMEHSRRPGRHWSDEATIEGELSRIEEIALSLETK